MSTLPERFWSKVNKTPTCWLWTAYVDPQGYGRINVANVPRLAHRVAWELSGRTLTDGLMLDHTCHAPACVNPAHLQEVDKQANMENRAGVDSRSQTGVRGVTWHKTRGKWRVHVGHRGRQYHGGYFVDISEAEAAAVALRNRLHENNLTDRGLTV